ncbi:MAG: hypothetical protein WCT51_00150 [Candidatus Shapirobacteria bacterium]|jgi:hypothetical protein
MKELEINISKNIDANIGSINSLEFQENGTERLKGSYTKLVNNSQEIFDHLKQSIPNLLDQNPSRLCSRYFVTKKGIANLTSLIDDQRIEKFLLKVEAQIPLGKIDRLNNQEIFWVWVGGNTKNRNLDPTLEKQFLKEIHQKSEIQLKSHIEQIPNNYRFVLLGTKKRISQLQTNEVPKFVKFEEITKDYATQIAKLYKDRMPIYVAPNDDPEYILNTVADSNETVLLVGINTQTNQIEAVMANEFTQYPLEDTTINICESNDWIKKRGSEIPKEVLYTVLNIGMINAINHQIDGIEVECVPESIKLAKEVGGFEATKYFLKRTSFMVTDGKNIEANDTTIPPEYRKFNSLFLFYITPPTQSWQFWKELSQKTT